MHTRFDKQTIAAYYDVAVVTIKGKFRYIYIKKKSIWILQTFSIKTWLENNEKLKKLGTYSFFLGFVMSEKMWEVVLCTELSIRI